MIHLKRILAGIVMMVLGLTIVFAALNIAYFIATDEVAFNLATNVAYIFLAIFVAYIIGTVVFYPPKIDEHKPPEFPTDGGD